MSFREQLGNVCKKIDGSIACSVMGFDGIGIDTVRSPGYEEVDIETLMIEFANAIMMVNGSSEKFRPHNLEDVVLNLNDMILIGRSLTDEYFAALILDRNALGGKGRYLIRMASCALKKELE